MAEPTRVGALPRAALTPSPPENADLELLRDVQVGNPRASVAFVRRYEATVFQLLGRMLGPRGRGSEVEDLAQETFLRVFRNLNKFDIHGPAKLSTWILTIATRLAINELKRAGRNTVPCPEIPDPPQDPEQRLAAQRALDAAIAAMTPEQQAAIVLREFHGLSDRESAEILNTNPASIRARISRGRARLRAVMQKEEHHD